MSGSPRSVCDENADLPAGIGSSTSPAMRTCMAVVLTSNPVTPGQAGRDRAPRSAVPVPSIDQSRPMMLLPTVLSLIAGSCDIISFIGLGGLFTAHITGNLVVLIARVGVGDNAPISYILSVPLFVAALALTTLFAALLGRAGMASLRPLLILQLLLLSGCFLLCVASGGPIDPTDGKALTAGMLAVSGMAVQNAIVQVSIKGMPSTAVMTTNVSRFVADFIAVLTERNRD